MSLLEECRAALVSQNMRAFLRVIRAGESSQGDDAYRTIVGGRMFELFDEHPRKTVHIPSLGVDSTAAGAYQFLWRTWVECRDALSLPDFSPPSQDLAAVFLIRRRGALADVLAGRVEVAIGKCCREWASLPGSPYGQPTRTMAQAMAVYEQYGGAHQPAAQNRGESDGQPVAESHAPDRSADGDGGVAPTPAPIAPYPPELSHEADERSHIKEDSTMLPVVPILVSIGKTFLGGLAAGLIDGFTPLAKEKVTRELARHGADSAAATQIVGAVVDAAKSVTGIVNPAAAVVEVQKDPAAIQQVEDGALATLDRLAPLLDKMVQWDQAAWTADEASRDAASRRSAAEANDQDPLLTRAVIGLLVGLLLVGAILIGLLAYLGKPTETLVGFWIATAAVAAQSFRTRIEHRYGSSHGSSGKDIIMSELARRPQKGAPG